VWVGGRLGGWVDRWELKLVLRDRLAQSKTMIFLQRSEIKCWLRTFINLHYIDVTRTVKFASICSFLRAYSGLFGLKINLLRTSFKLV
jgi:site-specific recombinase